MGYLISAYFDVESNQILSRYIQEIAELTGNHFMTDNKVPPHLTVSFFEARNDDIAKDLFCGIQDKLDSGEIIIPSVGIFFPSVIYAEAVQNEYLFEISKLIHEEIINHEEVIENRYYLPMSWLPHITLAKTLDDEQMKLAFEYMQKHFVSIKSKVERVGLAKTNPHQEIMDIKL